MRASEIIVAFVCLVATAIQAVAAGSEPDSSERLWQLNSEKQSNADSGRQQRHYEGSLPDAQELEQLLAREANLDPEGLYRLGLAYENADLWKPDYKKAFSYFKKSEGLGFPWAKAQLGYYYEMGLAGEKDYGKAVALYQQGADYGDIWSGLRLGYMYLDGLGVRQHDGQAFFWIQWASRGGSAQATASLGYLYGVGKGTEVDLKEAARLYEKAGESGFPSGWASLGLMYEFGELGSRDLEKAAHYYGKAAEAEDPRGTHHLGTMYYWGLGVARDAERGFALFEKALELGYAFADVSLGLAREQGRGVPQDYEKAVEHYQQAIDAGRFPRAMGYLGWLYAEGLGVERDYEKTRTLYEEAAEMGDGFALTELGISLVDGSPIAGTDVNRGRRLLERAAADEYSAAILALADMYERGLGVAADAVDAVTWYQKAVDLGRTDAMLSLGSFYEDGAGVDQDFDKAFELYTAALAKGNQDANLDLGLLYTNTDWPQHDFSIAMDYFRKSDELGDDGGSAALGLAYFNGEWAEEDLKTSRKYFKRAAEKGHTMASAYLGYMQEEGLGGNRKIKAAPDNYEQAALGDNQYAVERLADMYSVGRAVNQNAETALKWKIRAGELGNAEIAYETGLVLLEDPVHRDPGKAAQLLKVAANEGNLDASVKWARMHILGEIDGADFNVGLLELVQISKDQPFAALKSLSQLVSLSEEDERNETKRLERELFLGLAYAYGVIFPEDPIKAEQHLRKAATAGERPFPAAQFALAKFLFEAGFASAEGSEEVLGLLELAANRGQPNAQHSLGQIYAPAMLEAEFAVAPDPAKALMWFRLSGKHLESARFLEAVGVAEGWDQTVAEDQRMHLLEDLAASGNSEASYRLGYYLSNEEAGRKLDPQQALLWFEKAARFGSVDALNAIGLLHQRRLIENPSQEKAYQFLLQAAEAGHAAAAGSVGWHLKNGVGTERDLETAEHWYTISADGGDPWGKLGLAMLMIEEPVNFSQAQRSEAVSVLLDFSRRGSVHAWMTLGRAYVDGIGVEKSPEKGMRLYRQSLQEKPAAANTALGNFYFLGLGGDVDYELAFEHYSAAAELGSSVSQNNLGWMYENGLSVEQDYAKAAALYQQASDKGDPYAVTALGILYREGKGVPQDFDKANQLFQEAMRRGLPSGKANVGWMMLHGLGVPVNEQEGFELVEEAAALNDQDGTYYLAVLLEKGDIVEGNLQRAVELYEHSAEQGSFLAQAALQRLTN